jgi:hypothetical protein
LPKTAWVLIILVLAALFLPFGYGVDLGPGPDKVRALTWEYIDAPWFSGVRFVSLGTFFESILYTLPRVLFIYQVFRLYRGRTTKRRVVAWGIFAELFPALVSLIRIVGWIAGWTQPPPAVSDPYFPIYVPIPSLLIAGLVLMQAMPPNGKQETNAGDPLAKAEAGGDANAP